MKSVSVGEYLAETGRLTREQLSSLLAEQRDKDDDRELCELLRKKGLLSEKQIAKAAADCGGFRFVDLDEIALADDVRYLCSLVPEAVARQYCVFPFQKIGRRIYCAAAEPADLYAADTVRGASGCNVTMCMGVRSSILRMIDEAYSEPDV